MRQAPVRVGCGASRVPLSLGYLHTYGLRCGYSRFTAEEVGDSLHYYSNA